MPVHIQTPTTVEAAGTPPKRISEYAGRVATGTSEFSVARMSSPPGWSEPAQTPEFTECTVVLSGRLLVEHDGGTQEVAAGEAIITRPGETVRYATPDGAEYVAVCLPAFGPDIVHRHE